MPARRQRFEHTVVVYHYTASGQAAALVDTATAAQAQPAAASCRHRKVEMLYPELEVPHPKTFFTKAAVPALPQGRRRPKADFNTAISFVEKVKNASIRTLMTYTEPSSMSCTHSRMTRRQPRKSIRYLTSSVTRPRSDPGSDRAVPRFPSGRLHYAEAEPTRKCSSAASASQQRPDSSVGRSRLHRGWSPG